MSAADLEQGMPQFLSALISFVLLHVASTWHQEIDFGYKHVEQNASAVSAKSRMP